MVYYFLVRAYLENNWSTIYINNLSAKFNSLLNWNHFFLMEAGNATRNILLLCMT